MEEIRVCTDPLVLSGAKFCFCCVESCNYCEIITMEEYLLYKNLIDEKEK